MAKELRGKAEPASRLPVSSRQCFVRLCFSPQTWGLAVWFSRSLGSLFPCKASSNIILLSSWGANIKSPVKGVWQQSRLQVLGALETALAAEQLPEAWPDVDA